ncbi:MAG: lasso RiPP family leader peptide-containing protein [Chloroflexota bacterium]
MPRNHAFLIHNRQAAESNEATGRTYRKPRLEKLGDLRTLTLGGSPGINDSINSGTTQTRPIPVGFPQPQGPDGGPPPPLP